MTSSQPNSTGDRTSSTKSASSPSSLAPSSASWSSSDVVGLLPASPSPPASAASWGRRRRTRSDVAIDAAVPRRALAPARPLPAPRPLPPPRPLPAPRPRLELRAALASGALDAPLALDACMHGVVCRDPKQRVVRQVRHRMRCNGTTHTLRTITQCGNIPRRLRVLLTPLRLRSRRYLPENAPHRRFGGASAGHLCCFCRWRLLHWQCVGACRMKQLTLRCRQGLDARPQLHCCCCCCCWHS